MTKRIFGSPFLPSLLASSLLIIPVAAQAQMFGLYLPMRPHAPVYDVYGPSHPMPFREVAMMLHRYGFREIGDIQPRGETYRVAAVDRAGLRVSIVLDAYEGEILDVRPVSAARIIQQTPPRPPQRPQFIAALPQRQPAPAKPAPAINEAPTPSYPPAMPEVLRGLAKTR